MFHLTQDNMGRRIGSYFPMEVQWLLGYVGPRVGGMSVRHPAGELEDCFPGYIGPQRPFNQYRPKVYSCRMRRFGGRKSGGVWRMCDMSPLCYPDPPNTHCCQRHMEEGGCRLFLPQLLFLNFACMSCSIATHARGIKAIPKPN